MRLIDADELRKHTVTVYQGDGVELETLMVVPLKEIDNAETYNQVGHKMATAEGFITNPEWHKGDLISRDVLKNKLSFVYDCAYIESKSKEGIASDIIDEIDKAPTVEAISTELHEKIKDNLIGELLKYQSNLRPQGKWIPKHLGYKTHVWVCSECGNQNIHGITVEKACWKCGADMRGKEE